jgi:NADPH-dependent glutamate synthase beta subunit-like oxidoreductase/glutamate synthase domain-containing protein 3/ferredoxin
VFKINTLNEHERMSTQDLLMAINGALADGETDFEIEASGQHDIGGPLWHPEGKKLKFHVKNAGQRLGSMCLDNTEIIAEGSVSADVGWLNAGGRIVVKGDAGDTAGHCAAGGTIYIGGRAGTRSGSLMKHDPLYDPPHLWILKNVGSFSFEFMGGGKAVVCGYDSEEFDSVLGDRACIGMVGGTVYFRGKASGYAKDLKLSELDDEDIEYLSSNMDDFLNSIERADLKAELTDWQEWHKLTPFAFGEKKAPAKTGMADFRKNEWVKGGIFSDVCMDDFAVLPTVNNGIYRLRVPSWDNAKFAAPCEFNCPAHIPTQLRYNLIRKGSLKEAYELILQYSPFPGSVCGSVCPNPCMQECTRGVAVDEAIQIGNLGWSSTDVKAPEKAAATGKKIAVLGGGVSGLNAAWQLALKGHDVTVYDEFQKMGGKLEQAIPRDRLMHKVLEDELARIESVGVKFVNNYKVDAEKFNKIKAENDAVIVATGGHNPRVFPWPGKEKVVKGLEFQKAVNNMSYGGKAPKVGKNVLVIGAGNSGMDAALDAYKLGAAKVTCIDVQKPAAFDKEIAHFKSLGGEIIWPVMTKEITDEGIIASDGRVIKGDMVIVTVGESPILDYLPEGLEKFRDWLVPKADTSVMDGVFAAGDVIKPGRLVDAIGAGARAAHAADLYVMGKPFEPVKVKDVVPKEQLSTAYFEKCAHCSLPQPSDDHRRCVSCGTCRDCKMCFESCPEKAIERIENADGTISYESNPDKCIGCGICAGVCPCGVWTLKPNPEKIQMYKTYNK